MAPHFENADMVALDFERFPQMLLGDGHPFRDRRLWHHLACRKIMLHFAEYPRTAVGRAADHHAVHAVAVEHLPGFRTRINVAVADDRNAYLRVVLDPSDQRPVRFAAVHLGSCTAVDRERCDARVL